MVTSKRATEQVFLVVLFVSVVCYVVAKPYYYFQDSATGATVVVPQDNQVNEIADKVAVTTDANGKLVYQPGEHLPQRIHGHLNQLYSHGSSAVKNVVDTVQPDLSNIRQDLTDVYQVTRENVNKKIEPIAHTVKPYIDHAQKVITPYVNQAKEEVPKLINQAGPALSKVGEQVRSQISEVLTKLKASSQQDVAAAAPSVVAAPPAAIDQQQPTSEQLKQAASNTIQQTAETVKQQATTNGN